MSCPGCGKETSNEELEKLGACVVCYVIRKSEEAKNKEQEPCCPKMEGYG